MSVAKRKIGGQPPKHAHVAPGSHTQDSSNIAADKSTVIAVSRILSIFITKRICGTMDAPSSPAADYTHDKDNDRWEQAGCLRMSFTSLRNILFCLDRVGTCATP